MLVKSWWVSSRGMSSFLFPVSPLMVYPVRYVLHSSCYCHRWTNWSLETATTSVCCHLFPVITGLLSQAAQCRMPTVKHVWQGFDLCGKRKGIILMITQTWMFTIEISRIELSQTESAVIWWFPTGGSLVVCRKKHSKLKQKNTQTMLFVKFWFILNRFFFFC